MSKKFHQMTSFSFAIRAFFGVSLVLCMYKVSAISTEATVRRDDTEGIEVGVRSLYEYDKKACRPGPHVISNPSPLPDTRAPEHFLVEMPTTVHGAPPIVMEVNRTWAPLGVDRFYALVTDNYYACAAFFRVVPDFVVQWGIAAQPEESSKWSTPIDDDPVLKSNTIGMVSFATAGPNTRTTQIFVNTVDNTRLDDMGFAPFARVIQGMEEVFQNINSPFPDPSQTLYTEEGNSYILENYPDIDMITELPTIRNSDGSPITLEEVEIGDTGGTGDTSDSAIQEISMIWWNMFAVLLILEMRS